MPENPIKTITVTEFGGPLTRRSDGDIKSGLAKYDTSWGYDPYSKPGNLTWMEQPTSILTVNGGAVVALNNHYSSSSNFVHVVDYTSSLLQITVTPTSDVASVIGAVSGPGGYTMSAGIVKYGAATERLLVGGDEGIGRVNTDGSSPSILSDGVSGFNTSRPRPMAEFIGKIYFGNGNNIGEIDSTNLIITAAKLSPGFPVNTYVQDLDVTPDGNYLIITVNDTLAGGSGYDGVYATATENRNGTSRKLYWNGIDDSFTGQEKMSGFSAMANHSFSDKNYTVGYDLGGVAILSGPQKILSLPKLRSPSPNATTSTSNMLSFAAPEYDDNKLKAAVFQYGQYDSDVSAGLFRLLRQEAAIRDDVSAVPTYLNVSNLTYSPSVIGAVDDLGGVSKVYYSTLEIDGAAAGSRTGKLWKFSINPTGTGSIVAGVYETQTQLFSKKAKVSEVRLYTEPLVGGNDFTVDLIGSGGSVIAGGSQRFVVGTSSVATGTDMVHFNPAMAPTYALGVRITNASVTGVANWTANKLELDITEGGK